MGSSKIYRFSASKLERMRKRIGDMQSEIKAVEGWQKSSLSPMKILGLFDKLRILEGYELVGYIFRRGGNGNGVVWAVPEGISAELSECEKLDDVLKTPKPRLAVNPEFVIEVDGSPESYLQKSILIRELYEFGALWHGASWSLHRIIGRKPKGFEWFEEVRDLSPKVIMGTKIIVEFYTVSKFIEKAVYRHEDVYDVFRSREKIVASGGGGYIL